MHQPPPAGGFDAAALHDLALLALVVGHGADADLDTRELDTLSDRLLNLDPGLSGDDVIVVFRKAAADYLQVKVEGADAVVARLGDRLGMAARRRAFALLRAVAEADAVVHPMESNLLRNIAEAWDVDPDSVPAPGEVGGR